MHHCRLLRVSFKISFDWTSGTFLFGIPAILCSDRENGRARVSAKRKWTHVRINGLICGLSYFKFMLFGSS